MRGGGEGQGGGEKRRSVAWPTQKINGTRQCMENDRKSIKRRGYQQILHGRSLGEERVEGWASLSRGRGKRASFMNEADVPLSLLNIILLVNKSFIEKLDRRIATELSERADLTQVNRAVGRHVDILEEHLDDGSLHLGADGRREHNVEVSVVELLDDQQLVTTGLGPEFQHGNGPDEFLEDEVVVVVVHIECENTHD